MSATLSYNSTGALSFQAARDAGDVVVFSSDGGLTTITDATNTIEVTVATGTGVVAGSGSHTVTITGQVTSVVLDSNGAGATFRLLSTDSPTTVTNTRGSSAAPDTVVIGDPTSAASSGVVQGIDGAVTVENLGGLTDLTIDDSADTAARSAVRLSGYDVVGLAPADIHFDPAALARLTVNGGRGGNAFAVVETVPGIVTDLNAGDGTDAVNVQAVDGSSVLNVDTQAGTGTVNVKPLSLADNLAGRLNVSGSGGLALELDYEGGQQGLLGQVIAGVSTISGLFGGGTICYSPSDLSGLTIRDRQVTFDFGGGNPLPSAAGTVTQILSDGVLTLRGTPPSGTFQSESIVPGRVELWDGRGATTIFFATMFYDSVIGYPSLIDTVPVLSCNYGSSGSPFAGVSVGDGPIIDGLQTLGLGSYTGVPRFSTLADVANKRDMRVSTSAPNGLPFGYVNQLSVNVGTKPTGLVSLSVDTGSGPFRVVVAAIPPGVTFDAETTISQGYGGPVFVTGAGIPAGTVAGLTVVPWPFTPGPPFPPFGTLEYDAGDAVPTLTPDPSGAVLIARAGSGSVLASAFAQIHVTHTDPYPVVAVPTSLPSMVEGDSAPNVVVATFTCDQPGATASDFTATSTSYGLGQTLTVVQDANDPHLFRVMGSLTFSSVGSYDVDVTVQHRDPTSDTTVNGTLVTSAFPAVLVPDSITVTAAPLSISVAPLYGTEGQTVQDVTIATFTAGAYYDTNGLLIAVDGGGLLQVGSTYITHIGTSNIYTIKASQLTFLSAGQHALTVSVAVSHGGYGSVPVTYRGSAPLVVADAPLAAAGTAPVAATEDVPFTAPVASFFDPGLLSPGSADAYAATIDWGDGTAPTVGTVTRDGSIAGTFLVTGSHTYADARSNGGAGTFTITTTIVGRYGGSVAKATTLVTVTAVPVPLTGRLDPTTDSGASQSDAITNDNQPRFLGTTKPLATVQLFAVPAGTLAEIPIGTTTADAQGDWSLTASAMADGTYTVIARSTGAAGGATAQAQLLPNAGQGLLVIDTQGPRVAAVSFVGPLGRLNVVLTDERSGLQPASLGLATNYGLARGPRAAFVSAAAVAVAADPAANPRSASVAITVGRPFRRSPFVFLVRSAGIRDTAGNALNGAFSGRFPSGGSGAGADFLARVGPVRVGRLPALAFRRASGR